MSTDRIEKKILLRAPISRVWRALSDAGEFGRWFGMRFDAPFSPGARVPGIIVPTTVDPVVAEHQKPYEGTPVDLVIDQMEPERKFSYRWHPGAVEPGYDYSKEPMTLVVFELQEVEGGTLLTLTETGFDQLPLERRTKSFKGNESGWTMVMTLVEKYVVHA